MPPPKTVHHTGLLPVFLDRTLKVIYFIEIWWIAIFYPLVVWGQNFFRAGL